MYESKAAIKSIGIVAPVIAVLVIALGIFGINISADVAGLPDKIAGVIDGGIAIVAIAVGIYGRIRATASIAGLFKAE